MASFKDLPKVAFCKAHILKVFKAVTKSRMLYSMDETDANNNIKDEVD